MKPVAVMALLILGCSSEPPTSELPKNTLLTEPTMGFYVLYDGGAGHDDWPIGGVATPDGGAWMLMRIARAQGDAAFVAQLGTDGAEQWGRVLGPPTAGPRSPHGIAATPQGPVVLTAVEASEHGAAVPLTLTQLDLDGGTIWERGCAGVEPCAGSSLARTAEGRLVTAGVSDGLGLVLHTFGDTGEHESATVEASDSSLYVQVAALASDVVVMLADYGDDGRDLILSRRTATGEVVWQDVYDEPFGDSDERPVRVAVAPDGRIAVTGSVRLEQPDDLFVRLWSADGELLWHRDVPSEFGRSDRGTGLLFLPEGDLLVQGEFDDDDNQQSRYHLWRARYAVDGTLRWSELRLSPPFDGKSAWANGGPIIPLGAGALFTASQQMADTRRDVLLQHLAFASPPAEGQAKPVVELPAERRTVSLDPGVTPNCELEPACPGEGCVSFCGIPLLITAPAPAKLGGSTGLTFRGVPGGYVVAQDGEVRAFWAGIGTRGEEGEPPQDAPRVVDVLGSRVALVNQDTLAILQVTDALAPAVQACIPLTPGGGWLMHLLLSESFVAIHTTLGDGEEQTVIRVHDLAAADPAAAFTSLPGVGEAFVVLWQDKLLLPRTTYELFQLGPSGDATPIATYPRDKNPPWDVPVAGGFAMVEPGLALDLKNGLAAYAAEPRDCGWDLTPIAQGSAVAVKRDQDEPLALGADLDCPVTEARVFAIQIAAEPDEPGRLAVMTGDGPKLVAADGSVIGELPAALNTYGIEQVFWEAGRIVVLSGELPTDWGGLSHVSAHVVEPQGDAKSVDLPGPPVQVRSGGGFVYGLGAGEERIYEDPPVPATERVVWRLDPATASVTLLPIDPSWAPAAIAPHDSGLFVVSLNGEVRSLDASGAELALASGHAPLDAGSALGTPFGLFVNDVAGNLLWFDSDLSASSILSGCSSFVPMAWDGELLLGADQLPLHKDAGTWGRFVAARPVRAGAEFTLEAVLEVPTWDTPVDVSPGSGVWWVATPALTSVSPAL